MCNFFSTELNPSLLDVVYKNGKKRGCSMPGPTFRVFPHPMEMLVVSLAICVHHYPPFVFKLFNWIQNRNMITSGLEWW